MRLVLIIACLVVAVTAAPITPEQTALRALPAVQHKEVHDRFGQYALRYVTAEGTVVSERGRLVPTPDGHAYVLVIDGETSFIGDDGKTYVTKYSAGLDGTKMEGAHLPAPVTTAPHNLNV